MTNRIIGRCPIPIFAFLLVLAAVPHRTAVAQVESINSSGVADLFTNPLAELQRRLMSSAFSNAMLPMEGAVDPDEYVVGPGDVFSFSLPAVRGASTETIVGADGRLLLPNTGPVAVGGMTLSAARDEILGRLRQAFQNTPVEIVLVQPRQFYVHVAGAVPSPGRALALPVARVSTILAAAYADTTWAPLTNRNLRPSLRNIIVRHVDSTSTSVDLLRYFASGNTETNPYLRDGDEIYVSAFDPAFESIYIDGAVLFPGPYDFRPNDTISSLVMVAGGFSGEASIESIRLRRDRSDGSVDTQEYSLDDFLTGEAGSVPLQPRDHLSIARKREILGSASAEGMVFHPGTYPIVDGVTTLAELIEKAGGLRQEALLRGAFLERRSLPEPNLDAKRQVFDRTTGDLRSFILADSLEIMNQLRMTSLDFLSRAYFAQELRMQNRVSIDLERVAAGDAEAIILRNGDRLNVPRDDKTVYVFGQVRRPGFVQFRPGMDEEDYIAAAGGRSDFANEVVVVRAGAITASRPGVQPILSGDRIFIDRIQDIADNPELQRLVTEQERSRSDARIRTTQTILQSVATVASVVALIVSLRRN